MNKLYFTENRLLFAAVSFATEEGPAPQTLRGAPARSLPAAASVSNHVLMALGLGALFAWSQICSGIPLPRLELFNRCVLIGFCQAAVLAILALVYRRAKACPSIRLTTLAGGALGTLGTTAFALPLGSALALGVAAMCIGAAQALLLSSWCLMLARSSASRPTVAAFGGVLVGVALRLVLLASSAAVITNIALAYLLIGFTCLLAVQSRSEDSAPVATPQPVVRPRGSYLVTLGSLTAIGGIFVGMTLNPYIIQSDLIEQRSALISLLTLALILVISLFAASRQPHDEALIAVPQALLLCGLFLFSSGILGTIILPLAFIIAAQTCALALALSTAVRWAAAATASTSASTAPPAHASAKAAARSNPAPEHVDQPAPTIASAALPILLLSGSLPCSLGVLFSTNTGVAFTTIATGASVCIAALAVFYAVGSMRAVSAAAAADAARAAEPPEPTLDDLGLTPQERRIAALILEGRTYKQITVDCDISERTVKFHAKNVFEKAGVKNRREFEQEWGHKDE